MRRLVGFVLGWLVGVAIVVALAVLSGCGGAEPKGLTETEGTTEEAAPPAAQVKVSTCDYREPGGSGCEPVPTSCHYKVVGTAVEPDPHCTPGALYAPSEENPKATICVRGFTKTIRPPVSYTDALKLKIMRAYGLTGSPHAYELDHLVALESGGAPSDPANLWPQPYEPQPGAHEKDALENLMRQRICTGATSVGQAANELATEWVAAYARFSPRPARARGLVE